MKLSLLATAVILMFFAASALAERKAKDLICHVGNEEGPGGEVYLDDPGCVPSEINSYFCPDAGKIDLISVAKASKHLNNPSHMYDGISDYLPAEVGASGVETWDNNGDGIDDGCEPDLVTVFATSLTFTADLVSEAASMGLGDFTNDGLGAGDAICNHLAGTAGLSGTYTAWLSDSSSDAKDRVSNFPGQYFLPDGTTKVADDFADILVCDDPACLDNPILQDETATQLPFPYPNAWTGTFADGTHGASCSDWTVGVSAPAPAPFAFPGFTWETNTSWTLGGCGGDPGKCGCANRKVLYCFED